MLCKRSNSDIGEAGVASLRNRSVRNLSRQPGGLRVQRQDAVGIKIQKTVQPAVQAVGPLHATGAAQLSDALRHFGNGDGR